MLAQAMPTYPLMFKTPEGQARYFAAYDAALKLWPVPVESFDVRTRFGPTHVHVSGPASAPPLLLLHGLGISSTMWYPNVAKLSRAYRVYALDTIGDKGKSVCTRSLRTQLDFVDWLDDVFGELQLEKVNIIGMSYGGFLGLNLALAAPERLMKLILLAPAASLLPLLPQFYVPLMAARLLPGLPATRNMMLRIFAQHDVNASPVVEQFLLKTDFQGDYNVLPPVYPDEALRQIKAPTLLLIGAHEIIYDPQAALKRAANLIPNIQTHLIPGAGHALTLDQPELVNARLLEFLNK
jgi:pimeloyl-ACP methyl ester carboxylesterase